MDWMLMPLRRYADFEGRSRRMEYWMFILGQVVLWVLVGVLCAVLFGMGASTYGEPRMFPFAGASLLVFGVVGLALLIPNIAVQVRRFHDQDKSGWLVLLNLIPYLGGLIVLVFMFLEGTRGPNRFGPDPKAEPGPAL